MTEDELRVRLECLIADALDQMLRLEHVEPGLLALIAGADAAIRALAGNGYRRGVGSISSGAL